MTWHTNHSTPSTSSQEQEAAFSLTSYLTTLQSERVKSKSTQEMSCSQDSETVSSPASPSGMTYATSTENRGEEQLIFSLEAFPAKTSVLRVKVQELAESVQAYGKNMRDSLKRYNLDLSLPKTHLCFALGDLELSSKTWPRWGIMLDGECSELGLSVRRTRETECGSWPTPTCQETEHPDAVLTSTGRRLSKDGKSSHSLNLADSVMRVGAPIQPKGQLNPSWVEWLMGWPIGYTDLKPLETDKFRNVQQWHSTFSQKD